MEKFLLLLNGSITLLKQSVDRLVKDSGEANKAMTKVAEAIKAQKPPVVNVPDNGSIKELLGKINTIVGEKGEKGEKGDKGDKGDRGEPGRDGRDGKDGKDGFDGLNGKDGLPGRNGIDGKDGRDGIDGQDGRDAEPVDLQAIIKQIKESDKKKWLSIKDIDGLEQYISKIRPIVGMVNPTGTEPSGASAFIKLTDAPTSYSGQAGKVVTVKADESGLEFKTVTGGGGYTVYNVTTASSTLTDTSGEVVVLCNYPAGGCLINLPSASGNTAKITIKKIDSSSNQVTIDGFGSETLDGQTNKVIQYQYTSTTFISDGSNWFII